METFCFQPTDMYSVDVTVHPHDGYSDTRAVDIKTTVKDRDGWCEPRVNRIFLPTEDLHRLGRWLQRIT